MYSPYPVGQWPELLVGTRSSPAPSLACVRMEQRDLSRPGVELLPKVRRGLKTSLFDQCAPAAERELRRRARDDVDKCCGYFPALAGTDGIVSDLPASRMFASEIPQIIHDGCVYHFNFLRVSLVQQGSEPEFHLDSDAATALTGDAETLQQRYVLRMVLNLSRYQRPHTCSTSTSMSGVGGTRSSRTATSRVARTEASD